MVTDLKSPGHCERAGSSPAPGTIIFDVKTIIYKLFIRHYLLPSFTEIKRILRNHFFSNKLLMYLAGNYCYRIDAIRRGSAGRLFFNCKAERNLPQASGSIYLNYIPNTLRIF